MIESLPKHVAARAVGFTALCALLLVAACETRLPTSSEIDEMDAVAAEGHLTRLHVRSAGDSISYLVDGVEVTAAEAHAIAADQIARIDVRGAADGDQVWIHTLREIREDTTAARLEALHAAEITGEAVGRVQLRPIREGTAGTVSSAQSFHGLLVIDGEVVSVTRLDDTLSELGPDRIERIEVLKGPAATREYSQPEAANGVIRITTKK